MRSTRKYLFLHEYLKIREQKRYSKNKQFQFVGTWFVDSGYMTGYDDFECFTVTATQHSDGGFRIFTQAMNATSGVQWFANVRASLIDPPGTVQRPIFAISMGNEEEDAITFQVVATDFTSYALLWGCENSVQQENVSFEHAMLLTREIGYQLDPVTSARVQDLIDQHVVRAEIREVRQDKATCLGWPEPY